MCEEYIYCSLFNLTSEASMKAIPLAVLFLATACLSSANDVVAPRFTVNLDLPPQERWTEISSKYSEKLVELLVAMGKVFPNPQSIEMLSVAAAGLVKYLPEEYREEIRGIAKYANVSPGSVALLNIFYDISTFRQKRVANKVVGCTSIVAEDLEGKILHARNLDFFWADILRQMVITVDFQKKGKTIYTGTTTAGFVGLVTGQKPYKFTISLDQRNKGDWSLNSLQATKLGTKGFVGFLIRDVLGDPEATYETAVKTFSMAPLVAPAYIIIGGVKSNEGVVITRGRTDTADTMRLDTSKDHWFVVETNYDPWNPPPRTDDRRDPAISALNSTGRKNICLNSLFKVLSVPPVINEETICTVTMSAAEPHLYKTVARRV